MKARFIPYLALVSVLWLLATVACSKAGVSEIDCTKEQQSRLLSAKIEPLKADASALTSIDATDVLGARFDFAAIVKDLHFIPLETTKESRVGSIRRLTFTDDNIIVSDAKGVKVFSSAGRFVGGIPFGASSERNDYTVDRAANEIIVYTQGSIGHYTMDCSRLWVESIPLSFTAMNTTKSGDNLVLFLGPDDVNPNIEESDGSPFLIMDRRGAITGRPEISAPSGAPAREGIPVPFSDSGVVVCQSGCDTVFFLTDTSLSALYSLSYAKAQADSLSAGSDRYFFAGNALVSPSGLFFKIQNRRANTAFCFYDSRTRRLTGGIPTFDYRQIPPIYNPIATCGDYYVAIFNTYLADDGAPYTFTGDIVPEPYKSLLRSVRHDDNPVLALYRVEVD